MTNYFPHLIWLLRDFSLEFDSETKMTSDDYMEKALLPRESWEENSMKRIIRNKFKQVFPKRNCHTLVRPVNDEKLLRNIESIDYEDLRKEFRIELSRLLSSIQMESQVKKVRGKALNGKTFALFLRHISDCLNSDSFPGISTVDERLSKYERKQVVKKAVLLFSNETEALSQDFPMSETMLGEKLEDIRLEIMTGMQTQWIIGKEWIAAVMEFKKKINPLERELFEENLDKSRETNTGIMTEIIEEFRVVIQDISKELEYIEPKIEDLGYSMKDEDLGSIMEQSRQSVMNMSQSRYKRRLTKSSSMREKMVKNEFNLTNLEKQRL